MRTARFLQHLHHLIDTEASRLLAWWKFPEGPKKLRDISLGRYQEENAIDHPVVVGVGCNVRTLVRGMYVCVALRTPQHHRFRNLSTKIHCTTFETRHELLLLIMPRSTH